MTEIKFNGTKFEVWSCGKLVGRNLETYKDALILARAMIRGEEGNA